MAWLPKGEKSFVTCLAVSTQYRVTDRRASCDSIVRARHSIAREKVVPNDKLSRISHCFRQIATSSKISVLRRFYIHLYSPFMVEAK